MFEEKFLANKICLKMVNERKSEHLRQDIKRIRYLDISCEEVLIVTIEKEIRCSNTHKRNRNVCKKGQN